MASYLSIAVRVRSITDSQYAFSLEDGSIRNAEMVSRIVGLAASTRDDSSEPSLALTAQGRISPSRHTQSVENRSQKCDWESTESSRERNTASVSSSRKNRLPFLV